VAKILVADDNSNIQKMVGLALKDQGIDVVAVGNGEAAVRKISDVRPDLVLADVFMPVRNGYEVCRYVKEDSSLSHIPVILLVGAFDPLDEQEAQRVGADGVLKKPFVPPDPLISMVKSALQRAGVSIGPAPAAEKVPPPPPKRSTADILSAGVSSKLAEFSAEKLPEINPEPLEEFPTAAPQQQVKIAAGSEPLAFGSLLETPEAEDLAVTSKPMINLAEVRKWNEETDEVEEEKEEEEESSKGGWRPGGLDEDLERVANTTQGAKDWRDEAFHGNSPAKSFTSNHWAHSLESKPTLVEAAESVAVATEVSKPVEAAIPFTSDAWAAAMAAGVEEKLAEIKGAEPVGAEATPEMQAQATEQVVETVTPAQDAASVAQHVPAVEPTASETNYEPANWAPVPETAWEAEAKKASLLASTWDSPKSYSVEETQEIPAYSAEMSVEHVEAPAEQAAELSAYSAEPVVHAEPEEHVGAPANELVETPVSAPEVQAHVEPGAAEASEPKSWENAWEAPAAEPAAFEAGPTETAPVEPAVEESHLEAAARFDEMRAVEPTPATMEKHAPEPVLPHEPAAMPEPVAAQPAEPDMDELVARVLGKMNPEVLQKVTREILKPVIEAIVRDEINSKKS